ncbi:MAG: hypothetical protein HKN92_12410 [Chitinophagales bacterium]|nr:hypothetical protein [Chitinophagales bacterium]
MKRLLSLSIITAAIATMFGACGIETSACKDCKSAMEHMAEKIYDLWCDPTYMENAQERIKDACGLEMSQEFIGYLSDRCQTLGGMPNVPPCLGGDWPTLDEMMVDNPLMWVNTISLPDSMIVRLELLTGTAISETMVGPSGYFYLNSGNDIAEGTIYTVVLKDKQGIEIMTVTKEFTFARPDIWSELRTIRVSYDLGNQMYDVVFEYWGS